MTKRQSGRGARFQALHRGAPFLIPNPWVGSARLLESLGFEALASSSSALAFTLGRPDGGATLEEVVDHGGAIDAAVALPLSVDLENGYGPDPEDAVDRVRIVGRRAAEANA